MTSEGILPKWEEPAIRVLMMPRDTNAHGTIFGGVILSYIDQAGAIEARRQGLELMVTVSMDKVVFHEPVLVGDLMSFWTETLHIGNTSITTKVVVEAIRAGDPSQRVTVTEAQGGLRESRSRPEEGSDSAQAQRLHGHSRGVNPAAAQARGFQ